MIPLRGRARQYTWGSPGAIPAFFGHPEAEGPIAEIWLGAHPDDPASVGVGTSIFDEAQLYPSVASQAPEQENLAEWIAKDPVSALGESVIDQYGEVLPYLLKVIAPNEPLSLQVHPSIAQAREGYEREDAAGIAKSSPMRNYKDRNHKPELVYALTSFEALAGFRAPRRIRDVLKGLDAPLAQSLREVVRARGVRDAFAFLLSEETRPTPAEVAEVVEACTARLAGTSPSPRADRVVGLLARHYPGDPGVVASLLMNPVTLAPGEAFFVSAGTVHAYLKGVAVEIMAASDNVLRAGLTPKHVDIPELLRVLNPAASPPTRIAAERVNKAVATFYAPVDDFELSDIHLRDSSVDQKVRGVGPRTVLCLRGAALLQAGGHALNISAGQAVFVPASDGPLSMRGVGHFVQAAIP